MSIQTSSHIQQPEEAKSTTAERQPLLPGQATKLQSCLPKYKLRKFSSKGALLVLFWNFAVWCCYGSPIIVDHEYYTSNYTKYDTKGILHFILPLLLWLCVSVLSGWLADVYFGRSKVVRTALVLVWIGQLCVCSKALLSEYWWSEPNQVDVVLEIGVFVLWYSGTAAVLVNSVQLGIEQMPAASTDEITSFISCFVLCMYIAIYTGVLITDYLSSVYLQLGFHVLLTVALASNFLLSETWIIDLPGSGNPFKGVYRVLKYSWKHKFPVQRSAFTYCEDEIPSRIDFGKEKYGGPFTTEQVEDVKTILRILLLSLPTTMLDFSMAFSVGVFSDIHEKNVTFHNLRNMSTQHQTLLTELVATPNVWVIVAILMSEFVVYPLARNWIPKMLKRMGIALFIVVPYSLIFLVINIIAYNREPSINTFWLQFSTGILSGVRTMLLTTTVLEFICAQAPLAVKGFLIGFVWSLYALAAIFAKLAFLVWVKECSVELRKACGIAYYSFALVVALCGFIVYCVLAKWYKGRSRDEPSTGHTLVEEVYSRYVAYNESDDYS